jgi:hypothetical protein
MVVITIEVLSSFGNCWTGNDCADRTPKRTIIRFTTIARTGYLIKMSVIDFIAKREAW